MACCWELSPNVLVCILHTDNTTISWAFDLRRLIIPGAFPDPLGLAGMPYDMARNQGCEQALRMGADYVFFLDSDCRPPRDAILRLLAHKVPIVSGVYCRRSPPHGVPVMLRGGNWVTELPNKPGLIEVDLVGAGCLLIRRDVLERLPPQEPGRHWFNWKVDKQGHAPPGECLSEDFTFNLHARRHGYKTMVDPTIRCKHVGLAEADYRSFVPLGYAAVGG